MRPTVRCSVNQAQRCTGAESMSDRKSTRHLYRHRWRCPDPLGDWENEGGSLCWTPAADRSGRRQIPSHADPDFALLDALPLGILITNHRGNITYSNPACQRMYAVTTSRLIGIHWSQLMDSDDQAVVPTDWRKFNQTDRPLQFEVRIVTGSGQRIWTRHSIARLGDRTASGAHIHTIEDISGIKAAEQAKQAALDDLSGERERARVTLECIGDAVISTNARGHVTYLNPVAERLTGWLREEAGGQALDRVFKVIDPKNGKPIESLAGRAMASLEIVQMPTDCVLLRPDGSELAIEDSAAPILDKSGQLTGAVVVFRDRRLSRENTARMAYLARHDALTGLPNRVAFGEHFDQALKLSRRHHRRLALLFIDLDQFKQVNDSLGHHAGDRLLRALSRKLAGCVRGTDLLCRYGGDEFVALLNEVRQPEDAGKVALKMRAAAAKLQHTRDCNISLEVSIGISICPEDGTEMDVLMHRADAAMYHAKIDNEKGYCFHEAGMERPVVGSRFDHAADLIQHSCNRDPTGQ